VDFGFIFLAWPTT